VRARSRLDTDPLNYGRVANPAESVYGFTFQMIQASKAARKAADPNVTKVIS
jgi:hypothetical protein